MKVLIPSSIVNLDLDHLVTGRSSKKRSTYDAIYYLVSCLTPPVYNLNKYRHLRGFKPLSSRQMNRMTRNRFNEVKTILMDRNVTDHGPILLEDDLFIPGVKHMGYKLSPWVLNDTNNTKVEIDMKYEIRKNRLESEWELEVKTFEEKYIHVKEALNQSNISIDRELAGSYLKSLEEKLLGKVSSKKKPKVKAYIKKLQKTVDLVENKEFNYSLSLSNHRVNTVFTSMKRELRYFLRSNGNKMVEIDLVTSHPFTLATILTEEFFTDTKEGYNLSSMYPQFHKYFKYSCESMEYQDYVEKFARYMVVESNVVNDNYIVYETYMGDKITNIQNPLLDTFVSYMCGRFWRKKGIHDYRSLDFKNDIYQSIGEEIGMSREKVKDQFKLYINYSDKDKRINVELIKLLEKKFREVSKLIQYMSNLNYFKSPLSYLIQRCESYLFIQQGCNSLSSNNITYITIHDSVLCNEERKHEVKYLLADSIMRETGITPGIKFKDIRNPFETLDRTANDILESFEKEGAVKLTNREQGDNTEQNSF